MPTSSAPRVVPDLSSEGTFVCKSKLVKISTPSASKNLSPFERLYAHHTKASIRKDACFKPDIHKIPQDDLDFILASIYDHSLATFIERGDELLHLETIGLAWKLKSNVESSNSAWRRAQLNREAIANALAKKQATVGHQIVVGGIKERRHPMNIKLMNSSHHSPQTIGGYTRQDRDGTRFNY